MLRYDLPWFDSVCRLLFVRVFLWVFIKTELNKITLFQIVTTSVRYRPRAPEAMSMDNGMFGAGRLARQALQARPVLYQRSDAFSFHTGFEKVTKKMSNGGARASCTLNTSAKHRPKTSALACA
jgi:hypothetical protein